MKFRIPKKYRTIPKHIKAKKKFKSTETTLFSFESKELRQANKKDNKS